MQARGYSLVEIIVVTGMISVLIAIAALKFPEYARRYRTEAQTRMIYDGLLQARLNALYLRRENRVKFYPGRFEVYSSVSDGDSGAAPVSIQVLLYPIVINGNNVNVDFDEIGKAVNLHSICIAGSDPTGAVDSVVISLLKVSVGKRNPGGNCIGSDITLK